MTATIYDFHTGREITGGFPSTLNSDEAVQTAREIANERDCPVVLKDPDAIEVERTMFPTVEVDAEGYHATLIGDTVHISRESGVWVGSGDFDHETAAILNCDALLGDVEYDGTDAPQREAERIYDALEAALEAAIAKYTEGG